jgi:hypothetical protein
VLIWYCYEKPEIYFSISDNNNLDMSHPKH